MLPYDLTDSESKHALDQMIEEAITQDEATHEQYIDEWNEADARLNGNHVPNNWSTKYSAELARLNLPENVDSPEASKQFVTVNRARPNHESVLGEFIVQRRKLIITGRTPKDRNRATVLRQRFEYIEDTNMVNHLVYFPCMDQCFSKGLSWSKVTYNPAVRDRLKRYRIEYVSARDVLVDSNANMPFFLNARRVTHRMRFLTKDLKKVLRKYPAFDESRLSSDTDYSKGWSGAHDDQKAQHTTLYWHEFSRTMCDYFFQDPTKKGEIREITESEAEELLENDVTAPYVIDGPEEERFFIVLYLRNAQGAVYLEENKNGMFLLQPWINMYTEQRTYPMGDIKVFANLLDLLDTLLTVFFDNARRMNRPIATVDAQAWDEFSAQIEKALEEGGAAPGIGQIHYPQSVNQALTMLIPWVLGWIQDSASQHEASRGELPTRQIAKETVQLMIAKDRKSHGRKDVTIDFALTMIAKCTVKTISMNDHDEDFVPITDARPGQPDYIPINVVWSEEEYQSHLASLSRIPEPTTLEEMQNFIQQVKEIRARFELTNDVVPETVQNGLKLQEKIWTPQEFADYVESLGITPEEFYAQYGTPQQGKFVRFHVNELTEDADVNTIYRVDTDFQNDSDYLLQRAHLLRREGVMSRGDYARELGVQNADELIERADNENEAIQLAKQLAANPQLYEAAKAVIQMAGQKMNGQGVPA